MPRARGLLLAVSLLAVSLAVEGSHQRAARADEPVQRSAAQALFQEARALMTQGLFHEACPKLAESMRLEGATGTLLNLALCHELDHKTATAWIEYNDALALAVQEGSAERQEIARGRIQSLEPKLTRVTLVLPPNAPADTWVALDGVGLGAAAFQTPVPLDPGEHEIESGASGRVSVMTRVSVTDASRTLAVQLPSLLPQRAVESAVAPRLNGNEKAKVRTPSPLGSERSTDTATKKTERAFAYALGGVGTAGIVTGVVFGALALHEKQIVGQHCAEHVCRDAVGVDAARAGSRDLRVANVGLAVGAVGLVTGGLLWWHSGRTSVSVAVGANSALLYYRGFVP